MSKTMKIVGIVIASILTVGIVIIGGYTIMQKAEQDQMVKVIKSEEARKVYEEQLKFIDSTALTEKGIIQSYKIKSFEHNPMGGIIVYLYVNNNKKYKVTVFLGKNQNKIEGEGGSWSPELDKLVKKKVTGNE
ncbi:DUF1310 domain-containing protein [Streptococcus intermedius]|uniref:DUF1310 family protein n=1 Tax=Streptococcus intermedius TaxID=1338 RepID=UPI0009C2EB44|nr:DUF1310 family protein [Streptococcus intermedius]ARC27252.1 DUF1310 domain-containing protein [Streptococcus intermedius]